MSMTTTTHPTTHTVTRVLQRQILPLDRDLEVMALYVDLEDARLDEDKYVVGGTQRPRTSTTPRSGRPPARVVGCSPSS